MKKALLKISLVFAVATLVSSCAQPTTTTTTTKTTTYGQNDNGLASSLH